MNQGCYWIYILYNSEVELIDMNSFPGYRPDGFPGGGFGGFPGIGPGGFPGGGFGGFSGLGPGGFPGFPGGASDGGQGVPLGRPPAVIPPRPSSAQAGTFAVDPGAIRRCLFRFVAIYPDFGRPFWAWLVFVGRRSASGYRWTGFRWVPFGIDLDRITYFQCV